MNVPQAGELDPAPALAVVLVTWNVRELALAALESLFEDLTAQGPPDSQVWLVDNASADGTAQAVAQRFPQVHLIASEHNLGFGAGNNLALRAMGFGGQSATQLPKAVYLLNPDTLTQPGATRALYDALLNAPDIGLVGAQLCYEDGSFQHSAFQFPGLRQLWAEFYPLPGRSDRRTIQRTLSAHNVYHWSAFRYRLSSGRDHDAAARGDRNHRHVRRGLRALLRGNRLGLAHPQGRLAGPYVCRLRG